MADNFSINGVNIQWLGHASFKIKAGDKDVYIDPYVLKDAEKADLVLVTHDHYDHCDAGKIEKISKEDTIIITTKQCADKLSGCKASTETMEQNEEKTIDGIKIKTIPSYNIGKDFHPKGRGIGFIIEIDGKKIYHAGDTDKIPEMNSLAAVGIDVALLPVGGTYTMDAREAAEAAKIIKPKIAVPMHWGMIVGSKKDAEAFAELLKGTGIIVKILD